MDFKEFLYRANAFNMTIRKKDYIGVYANHHVDRTQLPENVYAYDLRETDDGRDLATIENSVFVNYGGTIILFDKLDFGKKDFISLKNVQLSWGDPEIVKQLKGTVLELGGHYEKV